MSVFLTNQLFGKVIIDKHSLERSFWSGLELHQGNTHSLERSLWSGLELHQGNGDHGLYCPGLGIVALSKSFPKT